jgi:hypothetical protein
MPIGIQFRTFQEMIDIVAPNMPHAFILDWWRRLELTLRYYTIAHHNRRSLKATQAIRVLEMDSRFEPEVIAALHELRRIRNVVAHGQAPSITFTNAASFAARALNLIGRIASEVPDDLAVTSGAATVA